MVTTLGYDKLKGIEKNSTLTDLMKIYYAIGGFSENQGESERAYDYILNYVAKPNNGAVIHSRFSKLELKGPFNKTFAQFFMKYYKDNPDFMQGMNWWYMEDRLCIAHNNFEELLKSYPNRVVNGNEERSLLTPEFVFNHCLNVKYEDIKKGNESLAKLIGQYGYSQEQFEHIQAIYERAKTLKDKYIIMADRAEEENPITFRLLEKDDPLGFVLGDITNCCQHIGGAGESCVDDGYLNPNAGFLVFEENLLDEKGNKTGEKRIIGQAYIWYDLETKTVCYDNIEIPTNILKELRQNERQDKILSSKALLKAVETSATAIMSAMNRKAVRVERVTTGQGYNDLKQELSKLYFLETLPKAKHRSYTGYSDAKEGQFVIKTNSLSESHASDFKTENEIGI